MEKIKQPYFSFTPHLETADDVKCEMDVTINMGVYFVRAEAEKNGSVACYIPPLDIHFYAASEDDARRIGGIAGKAFVRHLVAQEGFTSFARKLKVLGYEPGGGILDWRKIFNKRKLTEKIIFKHRLPETVPDAFVGAKKEAFTERLQFSY